MLPCTTLCIKREKSTHSVSVYLTSKPLCQGSTLGSAAALVLWQLLIQNMLCYINSKFLKSDSHQSLFSNSCQEIRLKKLITAALNKLLLKCLKMNTDCTRTNPSDQLYMLPDKLLSHDGVFSYLLAKCKTLVIQGSQVFSGFSIIKICTLSFLKKFSREPCQIIPEPIQI